MKNLEKEKMMSIETLEQRKRNLRTTCDKECQYLDNQIQQEKDAKKRDRERKKQEKERNKSLPLQPPKPDPKNDPTYNAFVQDSMSFKELNEYLLKFLEAIS